MTYVYEAYAKDCGPLYVGCSGMVKSRIVQHRSQSAWVPAMGFLRLTSFVSREDALAFEKQRIEELEPPYNRALKPSWYAELAERRRLRKIERGF